MKSCKLYRHSSVLIAIETHETNADQGVSKKTKRKLTDFYAGYIEFNDLIVTYYERAVI